MKSIKILLILTFTISCIYAEQSVYSDSDFVNTDILSKKNSREIFVLKQTINQLKEKVEGLQSIVEGQANVIEQLRQKSNNNLENILNQLSQRVATLESKVKETTNTVQAKENKPVYVAQNKTKKINEDKKAELKNQKNEKEKIDKKVSSKELFKKAVLDFTKGKLSQAKDSFKILLQRKYKSASVNFYLGEIAYNKQKYKEAISYYQKSVTINDNANYMDKLLLHTAVSLKKKGKQKEANTFFNAVVTGYPDSASAKEAKKYIKK